MADSSINVQLPVQDNTQSVEVANFAKTTVASGDKITIKKALANKNNSLVIIAEFSSTATSGTLKILKGDNYPNAMLGDLSIVLGSGVNAILIQDASRFENRDGSIVISSTFEGTIYAVAKRAGLLPTDKY